MKMQLTPLLVTTIIDMLINSLTFVKYKNNLKMNVKLIYIYIYSTMGWPNAIEPTEMRRNGD
jgi:hypothetical protein